MAGFQLISFVFLLHNMSCQCRDNELKIKVIYIKGDSLNSSYLAITHCKLFLDFYVLKL